MCHSLAVLEAKKTIMNENDMFYFNDDYYKALQVLLDDGCLFEMPQAIVKGALALIDEGVLIYHAYQK